MQKLQEKLQTKLRAITAKLPDTPGVYFFMGKNGRILYIGKATSLRSRVRSYLSADIAEKRSELIGKMVGEAVTIEFEKTDSVLEALILESKLIKEKQPPYNIADKDQKSFNSVVITREQFPRVLIVREREITHPQPLPFARGEVDILYSFGPFPYSRELKEALKIIRKSFPFRDSCIPFIPSPDQPVRTGHPGGGEGGVGCFNYQIGLCPGVCAGAVSEKEYAKTIKHIKTFFEGNKKGLIKNLEREMKEYAKNKEFEKAAETKRKIFALKHIEDVALIRNSKLDIRDSNFRIEAYDIAHLSGTNMVGVMTVVENGEAKKSDYRMFKIKGQGGADDTRALKEILERRLKHSEWPFPDLIVADGGTAQLNAVKNVLENLKIKIPAVAVTKDKRHRAREILRIEKLKDLNIERLENQILLANSEAHRFAIKFHRKLRDSL